MTESEYQARIAELEGPIYWSVGDDQETLYHESIYDALIEWWDEYPGNEMPDEIEVCGWARDSINPKAIGALADISLYQALEYLDDDYGAPDGPSQETSSMKDAAREFAEAVLSEYTVWRCHVVKREMVNPRDFIETPPEQDNE